jgi:CDP-glycerol glycerophosphotransferase (TagB/SpsB family)
LVAEPFLEAQLVAQLRRARWDGRSLVLSGWAYAVGVPDDSVELSLVACRSGTDEELDLVVQRVRAEEVNTLSTDGSQDHSASAFSATVDGAELVRRLGSGVREATWTVEVRLDGAGGRLHGPFSGRYRWGSAGQLSAEGVADSLVVPGWTEAAGLSLVVARRAARSKAVSVDAGTAYVDVAVDPSFPAAGALLRSDGRPDLELPSEHVSPALARVEIDLEQVAAAARPTGAAAKPSRVTYYLLLTDSGGATRHVHWSGPNGRGRTMPSPTVPNVSLRYGPKGVLRIDYASHLLEVDDAVVSGGGAPAVTVTGRYAGFALDPGSLRLQGSRTAVDATDLTLGDGTFRATWPLLQQARWTDRATALPPGGYRLLTPELPAQVSPRLAEDLYRREPLEQLRLRVECDPQGRFYLNCGPPLADTEAGPYHQQRLRHRHRAAVVPLLDAVYLESFYGRAANDNTRAIFEELRLRRPDLPCYWAVADRSVEVPDGTVPLLMFSEEWWRVFAGVRRVVTNVWLSGEYEHRPHQRVLQAWHGTPLKTLGRDRIGAYDKPGYVEQMLEEVSMWDQLIVPNRHTAEVFRSAYGFDHELLEIGYPRNDVLTRPPATDELARLRARIGVPEHQRVVLYVPTWREDDRGLFRGLDFARLAAALGDGYRLLVRGHVNTYQYDRDLDVAGVLDVTAYPELAELYLVADVLVTDYSSAMFDFSVTGKPMVFFVPDLDRYTGELRGTYFSLPDRAPGPVVRTTDEVVDAVRDLDGLRGRYQERYLAWQQEFNAWERGDAAARAVDHLLADDR